MEGQDPHDDDGGLEHREQKPGQRSSHPGGLGSRGTGQPAAGSRQVTRAAGAERKRTACWSGGQVGDTHRTQLFPDEEVEASAVRVRPYGHGCATGFRFA